MKVDCSQPHWVVISKERGVTKFEELLSVGTRFLTGFHQGLEMLRRPPLIKSEMVERIIKANESRRLKAYVEAGCINPHDGVQNLNKLHTCLVGLQDHLRKAKSLLLELEGFMENVASAMQAAETSSSELPEETCKNGLDHQAMVFDKEVELCHLEKSKVTDYAAMMGIIYAMLKQDYTMQEKIVSSLNLKSSAGELESYCLMWSLRPFVNDEIMFQAWKLVT